MHEPGKDGIAILPTTCYHEQVACIESLYAEEVLVPVS
jgi:hypothetical protein